LARKNPPPPYGLVDDDGDWNDYYLVNDFERKEKIP
jgi:hypothetical protein